MSNGNPPPTDSSPAATEFDKRNISVIRYGPKGFTENTIQDLAQLGVGAQDDTVLWLSFEARPDEQQLAIIAELFKLHPGIVNQLTKPFPGARIEEYGDQRLVSTKMFQLSSNKLVEEDLCIVFGKTFVLSFQDGIRGDNFEPVRHRLRHGAGHIRSQAGEHLAVVLIDAVVDGYFHLLEELGSCLDVLQDDILLRHDRSVPRRIHSVKRDISKLRHAIWPLRDSLNAYYRDVSDDIAKHTLTYLRDCTENAVRVMEMLETNRELCSDLMDLHLSTASARMNEVMKVLTIITTLFIPPTFIAGIYGMNFNPDKSPLNMPELNWFYGYPFAISLMGTMVVLLLMFLRQRGCFQREVTSPAERR